jgi:hypothetical protein
LRKKQIANSGNFIPEEIKREKESSSGLELSSLQADKHFLGSVCAPQYIHNFRTPDMVPIMC